MVGLAFPSVDVTPLILKVSGLWASSCSYAAAAAGCWQLGVPYWVVVCAWYLIIDCCLALQVDCRVTGP
eukprot:scaffold60647_cov51-Cyclotella_meneghiniana.AAC.1